MEQTPDIFRRGKVAYEKLCEQLFDLFKILPLKARKELFNDKAKKINDDKASIAYKNMRRDMNSLLQYSLLDCGTNGEKVSYLEMLFIADIGDFELRLDHYLGATQKKNDKRFKCTYLMLPDQIPDDVLYYKSCIFEYVEPIRARMLKAFAIVEKLKRIKIEEELIQTFAELYEPFLRVDGRFEKEEPSIAVNEFKEFFFNHIKDYSNKIKSLLK